VPGSTEPQRAESEAEAALRLSAADAIRIARSDPNAVEARREHERLEPVAQPKPPATWQVGFRDGSDEVVQVLVDDPTATVRESWTGYQVEWQMARGYEGAFGHVLNAPFVWLPLSAIFFLGLLDWRRPWRVAHLDLAVLLTFGISHLFFNRGEIGVSVPLAYPVLLYLLARTLWIGFRGRWEGLRPSLSASWLAIAAVFLVGFRIALNIADSGVIDVGYAGVIGADRIAHGEPLYGEGAFPADNPFGDTYGPANYFSYLPFELALPWSGEWDSLPAAHAAAIFFDLATLAGLIVLGRRLRPGPGGTSLAAVLAFAWAAFPYTAYALQSNANDTLIAALVVWSLALFVSPVARGVLLAAGTLVKFAPLALVPLYAAGERGLSAKASIVRRPRPALVFGIAFAGAAILLAAHPLADPGLASFWERTVESQAERSSPFSVWGQTDLGPLSLLVKLAVVGLGVALAFVPRRRTLAQLCALSAAILIAVQLTAEHWFYLYIVWFAGPLLAALAAGQTTRDEI
jgi:Glycosyltransferase family 87